MSNEQEKVIYSMHRVTKRHGQKEVLKDISLGYFYGAKIGVLGLNGAGKSSLLKILAGVDKNFEGDIVIAPGFSIGYLEQEPLVDETRTVREVVEEGVKNIIDLVNEFNEINAKFADPMEPEEMEALIDRQAKVQEKMDSANAWDIDSRLEMAMDALRMQKFLKFPAGKNAVLHFAVCFCKIPMFCFLTNLPTTSMQNLLHGWNVFYIHFRELLLLLPTTVTSSITLPAGF